MLVNLRDDDTNYFTTPDDLIKAYGDLIGNVPITLAAVPFITNHLFRMYEIEGESRAITLKKQREMELNLNAFQLGSDQKQYPLGENEELVLFLKKLIDQDLLEIALHGYNHRFYEDGAEFKKTHLSIYHVRDGKEYFEKLFNTCINVFVPPSNSINYKAIKWLRVLNMSLLTSAGIDTENKYEKTCMLLNKCIENPMLICKKLLGAGTQHYKLAGVNCINGGTFRLTDTPQTFLERVKKLALKDGYLSIASHYTTLKEDDEYRARYMDCLNLLKKEFGEIRFASVKNILQQIKGVTGIL